MGTMIKAKYNGGCKMCGSSWVVGDNIAYQRTPKAICSDKECFKEQGGTMADQQSTITGSFGSSIVTNLPDCTVPDEVKKLTDILDPIFLTAHYWTKDRYPAEEVTSDRFGRIRSQNMGYLLQLAMIYLKKDNQ
tara:strand:- start:221 stop:622 length:402 start_codon:yes stop_codon:yes gene_type:complete